MEDYRLELTFSDGAHGAVDLRDWIVGQGEPVKPLESPDYFRRVSINPDFGTISWPNGADFCADVLHARITGTKIPQAAT